VSINHHKKIKLAYIGETQCKFDREVNGRYMANFIHLEEKSPDAESPDATSRLSSSGFSTYEHLKNHCIYVKMISRYIELD
jgi:hypothetical protein